MADLALRRLARAVHHSLAVRYSLFLLLSSLALSASSASAQQVTPEPSQEEKEQEDLSERLIRQATGQEDTSMMGRIMGLMSDAAGRLKRDFDPGADTLRIQREIITKLDEAINAAQRRRSKGSGQQQQVSDKRQAQRPSDEQKESGQSDQSEAASESAGDATEQGREGKSTATGRLREFRRGWGNLPQRDREEVLQGIDEDVLEKYRQLIEDYFRALSEDEEE
ncbi:MAG TPA: hypothetical protein VM243_03085 [Phycisphaerae bacterium]|nr:hypothetical protein [Phycisphaerae bacterium]